MAGRFKDISTQEDIRQLVDVFYDRVRRDEMLAPLFEEKLKDRWPEHLAKMYRFWGTVLLEEHTYHGSPFSPHASLPLETEHFTRWLALFRETLKGLYSGPVADEAAWRAEKMSQMFLSKIRYFREHPDKMLL